MNRSDEIMERNERIFDALILRAEKFCPDCKALLMEAIQAGSEQNEI